MSSTLVAHNPRFNAQLTTRATLAALPPPPALGRWHKPTPHHELVDAVLTEADRSGLVLTREKYAVGGNGHALFAVLDFESGIEGRATSLGFRNSTDSTVAMQGVAGSHVFVCDNLALSGDFETWARKNTTGLRLVDLVRDGFARFRTQTEAFERDVKRLSETPVADYTAKTVMWDVFADGTLPVRLLPKAHEYYFAPTEAMTDCQPRTMWGVHNALTRCARELSPARLLEASTELGRAFRLGQA